MITLMRALDRLGTKHARLEKWDIIEFAAKDSSPVLRIGAIEELRYMLSENPQRALDHSGNFDGHPALLASHETSDFLYYALYRDYGQVKDFMVAMMSDVASDVQQRGAMLVSIASILPVVSRSVRVPDEVQELAQIAVSGLVTWRRGAAEVFAENIHTNASVGSAERLNQLLDDDDDQVQRAVSRFVERLRDSHIPSLHRLSKLMQPRAH